MQYGTELNLVPGAGAHEGKEHPTTRKGISTMKHLTHELVLPYKEAQFFTLIYICCSYALIIHLPLMQLLQHLLYKVKPLNLLVRHIKIFQKIFKRYRVEQV